MKDDPGRVSSPRSGGGRQRRTSNDGSASGGANRPRTPTAPRANAAMSRVKEEEARRPAPPPPRAASRKKREEDASISSTFLTALLPGEPSHPAKRRAQELRPPSPLGAVDAAFETDYLGAANGSSDPPATSNYIGGDAIQQFWRIFHRQDAVNKNQTIVAVRPSNPSSALQPSTDLTQASTAGARPRSARTTYLAAVRNMRLCAEPLGIVRRRIVEKGGTASSSASSSVGGSTTQEVNLSSYSMGDAYAAAFSQGFPLVPGVEALNVSHNRIGDKVAASLIANAMSGSSATTLQHLNLSNNALSLSSSLALCELLRDSKTLLSLNLSHNRLKDREIQLLCDALQKNQTLVRLHLSENKFGLSGMASIAKFLEENAKIEEIYLSWNQIRGSGALKIVEALKYHSSLRVCDLSWNSLASNDLLKPRAIITALADALANNKVLSHLDISSNRLDMEDCAILGRQLESNQTLVGLHLSGNSGSVDSRGFVMPKQPDMTLLDQHKSYSIAVFEETYSESGSGVFPAHLVPLVDRNCWYCGHWTEYRFAWTPIAAHGPFAGSPDNFEVTSDMVVRLHLSVDDWHGVAMDRRDDGSFTAYRILPPGRTEYFYSVADKTNSSLVSFHFLREKRHTRRLHPMHHDPTAGDGQTFGDLEFVNVVRLGRRDGRDPCNTLVPRSSGKQNERRSNWDINKSVFARRKRESVCRNFVDTDVFVAKACTADWRQCKIDRFVKDPVRRKEVEMCVTRFFREISNVYRRYCGHNVLTSFVALASASHKVATQLQNDVTCVPWSGYMEFVSDAKILDEASDYCKAADLENVFVAANLELTQEAKEKDNPDRSLTRFEFLESIIRIAINKYHKTNICDTPAKAVEKLLLDNVVPIMTEDANDFRTRFLYTEEVNDIFSEHIALLQDIYNSNMGKYCKPGEKKGMQLLEFLVLLEKYQVYSDSFRAKDVKDAFLACKLVVLDEMASGGHKKLYLTDFMELVLRVSVLRYPPRPATLPEVAKSLQKLFQNHFYKHEALIDQFCTTVDQALVQDRIEAFASALTSHRKRDEDAEIGGGGGGSTSRRGSITSRRPSLISADQPPAAQDRDEGQQAQSAESSALLDPLQATQPTEAESQPPEKASDTTTEPPSGVEQVSLLADEAVQVSVPVVSHLEAEPATIPTST